MSEKDFDTDWDNDNSDEVIVSSPGDFSTEFDIQDTNDDVVSLPPVSLLSEDSEIVSVTGTNDGTGEKVLVVQVDDYGNRHESIVDLTMPPLNVDEAKEITDKIKSTTNVLYLLIKRAHVGKAWKALGYNSFDSYVKEEFQYSRSYAYKLLNQANVIEAIQEVAPEGTEVYVGELAARTLKGALPEIIESVSERTHDLSPGDAELEINDILNEARENQRRGEYEGPENGGSSFDFGEGSIDGFGNEDYSNFPEGSSPPDDFDPTSSFEVIDDDDEELDKYLEDKDPSSQIEFLETLYTIISGAEGLRDIMEKGQEETHTLFASIAASASTRNRFEEAIKPYFEDVKTLVEQWNAYSEEHPVSNEEEDQGLDFDDDAY